MQTVKALKAKLQKQWQNQVFYKQWLCGELSFPLQVSLKRPTDKQLLHDFAVLTAAQQAFERELLPHAGVSLLKQQVSYATMGRQNVPVAVVFESPEALARFCGKWQEWQQFIADSKRLHAGFPHVRIGQQISIKQLLNHAGEWEKLIAIAHFFRANPLPGCYLRELPVAGVDSKFIEHRKQTVKTLLDAVLPADAINSQYTQMGEHGFEKRFGLRFDEPQIRFRLLDPQLYYEVGGLRDISLPISHFAQLSLMVDRVFITENLVNGLAFPNVKNALVIFGKGYSVQLLKQIQWLHRCRLYYWGDVDTDGFAMLSQIRGYFSNTQSLLMDEATLLATKPFWGAEALNKRQTPESLPNLIPAEAALYSKLKADHWQPRLRLEQERIPFSLLTEQLRQLGCK